MWKDEAHICSLATDELVLILTFFGRQSSLQNPVDVAGFAFVLLPLLFKEGPKLECKEHFVLFNIQSLTHCIATECICKQNEPGHRHIL